jgi:hypothetical protein
LYEPAVVRDDRYVDDDEARRELEATLAARKELGPEYDSHLAESFSPEDQERDGEAR